MRHHAFVIEAEAEKGIAVALEWAEKELGIKAKANPDIIVLRYGLFSPEDARRVSELAAHAPFAGEHKVLIISATRAYHEAQNALLKLFEEPAEGTYIFLVMASLGGLLPTLHSRVQVLKHQIPNTKSQTISKEAEEFLKASKEKRSAIIKKLTTGSDEEERRKLRDEAIEIVNGIEAAAYDVGLAKSNIKQLLEEIQVLRGYLYDRSAPVKQILEHLSLVVPTDLQKTANRKQ